MDFPQYIPVNWWIVAAATLICGVPLCIFGRYLFANRRLPAIYDALAWFFAIWVATVGFNLLAGTDHRTADARSTVVALFWFAGTMAIFFGWVRQLQNDKSDISPLTFLVQNMVILTVGVTLISAPHLQQSRTYTTGRLSCQSAMRFIGMAFHNFEEEKNSLPSQSFGNPPHSWRVTILPYLDEQPLHSEYDQTKPWDAAANLPISKRGVDFFQCPQDPYSQNQAGQYFTPFALVTGPQTIWASEQPLRLNDIGDGTSQTGMLVEACGQRIIWTEPRDLPIDEVELSINTPGNKPGQSPSVLSTYHERGANLLMADGSVKRVPLGTDPKVIRALLTANGGERDHLGF